MTARIALFLLTLATALELLACASCPYEQQCNGNKLEVCDLGVDQMFGDPSFFSEDCEAPNTVCVQTGSRTAQCVMAADATCDARQPGRCSSDGLAISCKAGYEVASDCSRDGNDCLIVDQRARCAVAPAVACDREVYDNSCEDDTHLLYCADGLVARMDCWTDGKQMCEPHQPKDQYEQSAFCRDTMTGVSDAGVDAR